MDRSAHSNYFSVPSDRHFQPARCLGSTSSPVSPVRSHAINLNLKHFLCFCWCQSRPDKDGKAAAALDGSQTDFVEQEKLHDLTEVTLDFQGQPGTLHDLEEAPL